MRDVITSIIAIRKEQDGGHPHAELHGDDPANLHWFDGNPTNITTQQVIDKQIELGTAYTNLTYARTRDRAYPSLKEFAEAYCEKEIGGDSTKWDAYVSKYNQVRSDNPKP